MKYEEIKVGESYMVQGYEEKVIAKSDEYKAIMTVDKKGAISKWLKYKFKYFKPLPKELPEEGLLVHESGSLIFRVDGKYGYGFCSEEGYVNYESGDIGWGFKQYPQDWQPATPEQKKQFVEMIKKEWARMGNDENTKIEAHADGSISSLMNDGKWLQKPPTITKIYNTNGMIFHKGKFATPLKEDLIDKVTEVVNEFGNHIIEKTKSGVILISKIK